MKIQVKSKKSIIKVLEKYNFSEPLKKEIIDNNLYNYEDGNYIIFLPDEKSLIPTCDEKIDILYEDEYLLIVNKKRNLDCLSSKRHYNYNLSSMVLNYYKSNNINSTIHLVNRLDYKTEGLVILAKHGYIHHLFNKVKIVKKYLLKVEGRLNKKRGLIHIKIKKGSEGIKRIISSDGKDSYTKYKLIKNDEKFSLVEAKLLTGRTHQIRLSFSSINHPLVGDNLYGNYLREDDLCLCAYYLSFKHPINKKRIQIKLNPSFKI